MANPAHCEKYGCLVAPSWRVIYVKDEKTKVRFCCNKHFMELIGKRAWTEADKLNNG